MTAPRCIYSYLVIARTNAVGRALGTNKICEIGRSNEQRDGDSGKPYRRREKRRATTTKTTRSRMGNNDETKFRRELVGT
eukprot:9289419-Pyramimonas_sp.AAC.1